jgi:hypothetical protein
LVLRGAYAAACLVGFLLSGAAVARAEATPDERQTTGHSPGPLARAIKNHALLVPPLARAKFPPAWDATQGVTSTQLKQCGSRKKGTIIGAAIGAVAGAAVGVYIAGAVSGEVLGASHRAAKYITYWSLGGAGAGALVGFAYCR